MGKHKYQKIINEGSSSMSDVASYEKLENESSDGESTSMERTFKVFIYREEIERIRRWVLMKDDIETGGDLFGLWIDQHTAVVQFVLGPGEKCRRTTTSFYQDVEYLDKVGKYLTNEHGLCNIGQWHSHHRLNLPYPSGGDETTVWGNMPKLGMTRYIVFIATIKEGRHKSRAKLNCFLFELEDGNKIPIWKGQLKIMEGDSPLYKNLATKKVVKNGAEQETKSQPKITPGNYVRRCNLGTAMIILVVVLVGLAIIALILSLTVFKDDIW